ncbi:MAG: hypothetical protein NTY19_06890 [Planctomycetota bacterium]|nr:hypothetical protein [Planctomycetota bacterium]
MLKIRTVHVTVPQQARLPMCSNLQSAYEHLCDHLLTRPEAGCWACLLPDYRRVVDPDNDNALFQYAQSLWRVAYPGGDVPGEQLLYDAYAQQTEQAIAQATRLGWYWEEVSSQGQRNWKALGKCGIFAIWGPGAVRTSMVNGFAAWAPNVPPTAEQRKHNPLPRQHSRGSHADEPCQDVAGDQLAYIAFKRSLKEFRREYRNARRESEKRRDGRWIGDLQIVQPLSASLQQFDYDTWRSLGEEVQDPSQAAGGVKDHSPEINS